MTEKVAQLILAHGAGAGKDSPFMQDMASLLSERGIEVILFDFDYMKKAVETGKKRPPEKVEKLQMQFQAQIEARNSSLPLFIGGKSMGGRVASMMFSQSNPEFDAKGCICLGYPFHPPGKADKLRVEHLKSLQKPLLVVQGERDTFGNQQEVQDYGLPDVISLLFLPDGDHSFKPRKASGKTLDENMQIAADRVADFIKSHR